MILTQFFYNSACLPCIRPVLSFLLTGSPRPSSRATQKDPDRSIRHWNVLAGSDPLSATQCYADRLDDNNELLAASPSDNLHPMKPLNAVIRMQREFAVHSECSGKPESIV